jgi:hypothetical protein
MNDRTKIIQRYNSGYNDTALLAEEFNVSQRWIQKIIEEAHPSLKPFGRTRYVKIFTILDIYACMNDRRNMSRIVNERYREHYVKANKNLLMYKPINRQSKRNILRGRVLERDGFMCVDCGSSIALEVHHIKPVKDFPELEFETDNCITLCRSCHIEIPIYWEEEL